MAALDDLVPWHLDNIDEAVTELERLVDTAEDAAGARRVLSGKAERLGSLAFRLLHLCQEAPTGGT